MALFNKRIPYEQLMGKWDMVVDDGWWEGVIFVSVSFVGSIQEHVHIIS